jgi:hypothetical protein
MEKKMSLKKFIENRRMLKENTLDVDLITEVKFNEKKLEKVAELYGKIMGKQMGGEFFRLGIENFKRSKGGSGIGIRTMNKQGEQMRFNWDKKLSKKGLFELTSIDYWRKNDLDFAKPYRRVEFSSLDNVVQVLAKIVTALKTGSINEAKEIINEANLLCEARSKKEIRQWIDDNGLPSYMSAPSKRQALQNAADKKGLGNALRVFLGEEEVNDLSQSLNNPTPPLPKEEMLFSDPEEVFNDIEDLTSLVASGAWNSLLVIGDPGVGKTFRITDGGSRSLSKVLGPEGDKWTLVNASAFSDAAFYRKVFMHRDMLIVFDEADKLLTSAATQEMLKVLLDTSPERMISREMGTASTNGLTKKEVEDLANHVDSLIAAGAVYDPGKMSTAEDLDEGKKNLKYMLPSKFYFTGQMIFIANLSLEDLKKAGGGAFLSRSLVIDVKLEEQDKIRLMKSIGKKVFSKNKKLQESGRGIDRMMEVLGMKESEESPEVKYKNANYMRQKAERGEIEGSDLRALKLWEVLASSDLPNYEELFLVYGIGSKV